MRNLVKLATLPLLIIAIGFLPASAGEDAPALVHPGIDGVEPPKVVKKSRVTPYYPAVARASRAEGGVIVAATVLRDGSVSATEVVACNQPNMGFEESALSAVSKWRFEPATKDGAPVDSYALVHLYFAPPSGQLSSGSVRADLFLASDLPLGLPGAPTPVDLPGGISTAMNGGGRPSPYSPLIKVPCGPKSGKCMYNREQLLLDAKKALGEPGEIRPMPK